ncbi:O-fucosyltransferase 30 [Pistacia vera]|uniref:O-fucosyltransferase 30 n=1 Tax=Pistacia vera TaxID=55513 RepID=UPI0012631F73|nr:O-fucosyltransferase 30 [Pistacia vera]
MKNIFTLPRSPKPWNTRRKPQHRSPFFFLSIFLFSIILFFIAYTHIPKSLLSLSSTPNALIPKFPPCRTAKILTPHQRFLFYAPHSGFSNQLQEFKNAILMAGILNRTLIVPPILDHHAVALGSCPKFRVSSPTEIRMSVWNHTIELLRSGRYVSIADVVDISSLVLSSLVQVIDFRVFASSWCGVDTNLFCLNELNAYTSLFDSLKQCGYALSGLTSIDKCLYAIDDDCRTTVWTYQNGSEDGVLDFFQPDEQLKMKKKISYVRRRRDVFKALGPGSEAELATVLAFGSLFTAPYRGSELYLDISRATSDQRIQSLIKKIEFIPFAPEILTAGKKYALRTIKVPFLCAQLRLLDGQFKNRWKATFLGLKQKLDSLRQKGPQPIHMFVMTDLPEGNWTGTYLGDLAKDKDSFKLYFLREEDDLVKQTAKKLATAGNSLMYGSFSKKVHEVTATKKHCPQRFSDVLLFIEETVCSCASLGFVGTAGSTIAESVELMRKFDACLRGI